MLAAAVIVVSVTLIASQALAADGDLDTTFGTGGTVTTDFATTSDQAFAMAIQSDGKIVTAGTSSGDFALVRYNTDGSVDATFDGDGRVATSFGTGEDQAYAVAIQADGRIVAAGSATVGATTDFALARYNTDGSLDTTFDGDGKVTTSAPGGCCAPEIARGVAVQSDGKIVAAGWYQGAHPLFALARYTTDGSLDTTFDGDGWLLSTTDALANSVAIQSDGKIVAAGVKLFGVARGFALTRYNPDGSLDGTFGAGGIVITASGTGLKDAARAVAIQPDGKIVAVGESRSDVGVPSYFVLVRYGTDGSLDPAFGTGGIVFTDFGYSTDLAYAVAIQCDGKIVAAGAVIGYRFALARYKPDGTLDTTFDGDGKVITPVGPMFAEARAVAIQSDGGIVAAGFSFDASNYDFALARYESAAPTCRPDAQIRGGPADATYLGDDVYNLNGAGQTLQRRVRPGFGDRFNVRVENDGDCPDTFLVHGAGGSAKFKIAYWSEGLNVTPEVVAGTFETPELGAGESADLVAYIWAKRGTNQGTWITDRISFSSTRADPLGVADIVGARVVVNRKAGDFNSQVPIP
jgi:uncharacterized delta-60 repeat protein